MELGNTPSISDSPYGILDFCRLLSAKSSSEYSSVAKLMTMQQASHLILRGCVILGLLFMTYTVFRYQGEPSRLSAAVGFSCVVVACIDRILWPTTAISRATILLVVGLEIIFGVASMYSQGIPSREASGLANVCLIAILVSRSFT